MKEYSIDSEVLENINILILNYYDEILQRYKNETINPYEYSDILISIACGFEFLEDKETWKQIGYDICKGIRQQVELLPIKNEDLGMFSVFGNICFSVHLFSHATGLLSNFSISLNKLLLKRANETLEKLIGKFETKDSVK